MAEGSPPRTKILDPLLGPVDKSCDSTVIRAPVSSRLMSAPMRCLIFATTLLPSVEMQIISYCDDIFVFPHWLI